jgi:hypothetical protein
MAIPKVCRVSEYYMNKDFFHAKNERLYVATKKDTIPKQFLHIIVRKKKKKLVQSFTNIYMLAENRPMANYET